MPVLEETVGGAQHLEFGTTVEGVAYLLLLLVLERQDELLGEGVALVQEGVLLGYLARHYLGAFLSISHWSETLVLYAVVDEVVDHAFRTALAQSLVVFVLAAVVAVGGKFDGDVGILYQQCDEAVQGLGAVLCQFGTVELVEHVADEYGVVDAGKGELQDMFDADAAGIHVE